MELCAFEKIVSKRGFHHSHRPGAGGTINYKSPQQLIVPGLLHAATVNSGSQARAVKMPMTDAMYSGGYDNCGKFATRNARPQRTERTARSTSRSQMSTTGREGRFTNRSGTGGGGDGGFGGKQKSEYDKLFNSKPPAKALEFNTVMGEHWSRDMRGQKY
jgi:hypothetical protein